MRRFRDFNTSRNSDWYEKKQVRRLRSKFVLTKNQTWFKVVNDNFSVEGRCALSVGAVAARQSEEHIGGRLDGGPRGVLCVGRDLRKGAGPDFLSASGSGAGVCLRPQART